jgi:3-phenylpropionate/trans-cinnamate dioxygenase ferredoxin subunit
MAESSQPRAARSWTPANRPATGERLAQVHVTAEVTIELRPNGPYIIHGSIELRDTNGNVLRTETRTVLCRRGASTKKPFCDGTPFEDRLSGGGTGCA